MADMIITLSGKQFSGKDTVAQILLKELKDFRRIGLGDAIKLQYAKDKNISMEEIEANKSLYRPDLIALGDKGRSIDPDYWLKAIVNHDGNVIVPDVRMPHEYDVFKAHNAFTIRVEASEEVRALRGTLVKADDTTETALDNIKTWDFIVYNDSTHDELVKQSYDLVDAINRHFNIISA